MTKEREALDMIAKLQMVEQTMEAACKRIDELKAENKALKEALAQPEQEPVALPDDFELLPVDPTPEMKSAAIEVELFDHDTGKDYMLSWEEAEKIYSAMLNSAPTPPQRKPLTPVEGDLLPAIGSKVLIHLARQDEWVEHTVVGYYVWGDLDGLESRTHRVFVRVADAGGILNARRLCDVRPVEAAHGIKE